MPCIVPTCAATVGTFKLFPRHQSLSERWLDAIHTGCGVKADDDDHSGRMEICQWHFGKPDPAVSYQEPKIFVNRYGADVEIESCRLCLRFYPSCEMVSRNGKLGGIDIKSNVYESLRIAFLANDFLDLVCTQCLARLELLQSIQKDFLQTEMKFQQLIKITRQSLAEVIVEQEEPEAALEPVCVISEESANKLLGQLISEVPTDIVESKEEEKEKRFVPFQYWDEPEESFKDISYRKCYICLLVLESADDLASHLVEKHSNVESYRCEDCSRDFPILSAYNRHLSRHDQTGRPYKCKFCMMCFKGCRAKMLHENTHHGTNHVITPNEEKIKPTICEICGESFMYMRQLTKHVQRKHGSTEKPKCKICGKTFTAQFSLNRHMLLHMNKMPYNCSRCDASFRRLLNYKHHVQKVHEGKNPHVCVECNMEFNTYVSLYNHKKFDHLSKTKPNASKPDQFKCKLCSETFPNKSSLQEHISTSHADESYPVLECPHCPRTFVSIQSLSMHKAIHTDKCVCKECGKRYSSYQALRNHVASVHEQQQFICPICSNIYKSRSALNTHMDTHTKGKRFTCDFCGKCFHRNDQLTIHRRLHTGEKPFQCPKCSMRFSDGGTFSKHKKRCLAKTVKIEVESADPMPKS